MTESDQPGQGGRSRRGAGRPAATKTPERPDGAKESATGTSTSDSSTGADSGSGKGSGNNTGASAKSSTPQADTTQDPARTATRSSSATSLAKAAGKSDATATGTSITSPRAGTTGARPAGRGQSAARKPRRARLRLTQVDAWTVMKTSFLLSIALGIVSVVAVAIIWLVLGAAGVFDSMNDTVQTLLGNDFRVQDYIGTGRILGFTMILAVVDVVLLTAIATLAAFLYNLAATLLGGIEVTLTEDS